LHRGLERTADVLYYVGCGVGLVVVTFVEIVWWTVIAALALEWAGVPDAGVVAVALVPLLVALVRVEDYVLEPRRARSPRTLRGSSIAVLVHHDDFGRLWDRGRDAHGDPIRVVEVVNATPDEDGSSRHYFLRVPPTVRTPQEAVAWTFGLGPREYVPVRES
jgi:hypothetical protein